jgi:glycosyltransferase 2 family protein
VRSDRPGSWEFTVLRRVNALPDSMRWPVWGVMQSGSLNAPFAAAAVAYLGHRPALAQRLVTSGVGAYFSAKVVKAVVRRGRPLALVPGVRVRGKAATGGGFVSGHAAVSMALAVEARRHLGRRTAAMPLVAAPIVGLARLYVGAHMPLDVIGGSALGWAIGSRPARTWR